MPEIISRKEAMARGLKRYFTGEPCRRGHVDMRRAVNMTCLSCARIACSRYQKKNPEKKAAYAREWRKKNPLKAANINRRNHVRNAEQQRRHRQNKYWKNPEEYRSKSRKFSAERSRKLKIVLEALRRSGVNVDL